jgi:hypothetical protein
MTRVSDRSRQRPRQRKADSAEQSIAILNSLSMYLENVKEEPEVENQTMPGPFEGIPNSSDHEDDGWPTRRPITRATARVTRLDNIFEKSVSPKVRKSPRLSRISHQGEPASSPLKKLRSRTSNTVDNEVFVKAPTSDQVAPGESVEQLANNNAQEITNGQPLFNVQDRDTNETAGAGDEIAVSPSAFRQQSARDSLKSPSHPSKKRKRSLSNNDNRSESYESYHPATDEEEDDEEEEVDIDAAEVAEEHNNDEDDEDEEEEDNEESEQEEIADEDDDDADDDNNHLDDNEVEDNPTEEDLFDKDGFDAPPSSNLRSKAVSLPIPRVEISPSISASHPKRRKKTTPRAKLSSTQGPRPVIQDPAPERLPSRARDTPEYADWDLPEDRRVVQPAGSQTDHTDQLPNDTLFLETSKVLQLQRSWRDLMKNASIIKPQHSTLRQLRFRTIEDILKCITELNAVYKEMIQQRAASRVVESLVRDSQERLNTISGKAFHILAKAQRRATSGTTPEEALKKVGDASALVADYETDVIPDLVEAARECLKAYYVQSSQSLAPGGFNAVRDVLNLIHATCERTYSLKKTGTTYTADTCRRLRPSLRVLLEGMKYGDFEQRRQARTDRNPRPSLRTGVVAVINLERDVDEQQEDWTEDETLAILDGLRIYQGRSSQFLLDCGF